MNAINHPAASQTCPSPEEWRLALRGQVGTPRWTEIEEHLSSCTLCESCVDTLTESSDTLVRHLCQQPSTTADEPAFQSLYTTLLDSSALMTEGDELPLHFAETLPLPRQLGSYQLLEPLGHGANGTVFKACHVLLDRFVAVKLLRGETHVPSGQVQRFVQEIRTSGRLNHPHLVRATDAGETDGQHFLVMDYIPGIDISAVVRKLGPLTLADACEIVRQTTLGLGNHQNRNHEFLFVPQRLRPGKEQAERTRRRQRP